MSTGYGKTKKKICFDSCDKAHADLKIRLHYDDVKIKDFFNEVVAAYINKDEHFMMFFDKIKERAGVSKNKLAKARRSNVEAKEIKNKFSLQEHEVENIFDIIEKEWNI